MVSAVYFTLFLFPAFALAAIGGELPRVDARRSRHHAHSNAVAAPKPAENFAISIPLPTLLVTVPPNRPPSTPPQESSTSAHSSTPHPTPTTTKTTSMHTTSKTTPKPTSAHPTSTTTPKPTSTAKPTSTTTSRPASDSTEPSSWTSKTPTASSSTSKPASRTPTTTRPSKTTPRSTLTPTIAKPSSTSSTSSPPPTTSPPQTSGVPPPPPGAGGGEGDGHTKEPSITAGLPPVPSVVLAPEPADGYDQCQSDGDCGAGSSCCIFNEIANVCIAASQCASGKCSSSASSRGVCGAGVGDRCYEDSDCGARKPVCCVFANIANKCIAAQACSSGQCFLRSTSDAGTCAALPPPPLQVAQDGQADACASDDDCHGSKVCCSFGGLEASTCIRQSACTNRQCWSSSGAQGFCDGN